MTILLEVEQLAAFKTHPVSSFWLKVDRLFLQNFLLQDEGMGSGGSKSGQSTIIFSPRVCDHVDLEVGNFIRIHPPWYDCQDYIFLYAYSVDSSLILLYIWYVMNAPSCGIPTCEFTWKCSCFLIFVLVSVLGQEGSSSGKW